MKKILWALLFGLVASPALAQGPSSFPGCVYNATPPTLSDKQQTTWQCDINGKLITSGGGNVVGPASSTDNDVVLFDGTTGKLIKGQGATLTASAPASIRQTWNNAGVTFEGLSVNVTNTNSGANSRVGVFKVGGTSIFDIRRDGGIVAPGIGTFTSFNFITTGADSFNGNLGIVLAAGPSHGVYFGGGADAVLFGGAGSEAANTIAQRNGTNAQTFNLYGTYTDASNYERLQFLTQAGNTTIATQKAGSGTLRSMALAAAGFVFNASGTDTWNINGSGHLLALTDNTFDIGASGATRPRIGYFGTAVIVGSSGSGYIYFPDVAYIQGSGTDGILKLLNSAGTSFGRLQFGGTTSSFPALARNGIKIDVKLADDSTYAPIAASAHIVAGTVPTLALAGGTCAGTVIAGGATAGTVTLTGACAATNTMTLTNMPTAPTGYACDADDRTLGTIIIGQSATTTTGATFKFSGTTGATDVIQYKCIGY